jgi:hypothetical protein
VPNWKREQWADGITEWVHPGVGADKETGRRGDKEIR